MNDIGVKIEAISSDLAEIPTPVAGVCAMTKKAHDLVGKAIVNANYIQGTLFGFPEATNDESNKKSSPTCLSEELDSMCVDLDYLFKVLISIKEKL